MSFKNEIESWNNFWKMSKIFKKLKRKNSVLCLINKS